MKFSLNYFQDFIHLIYPIICPVCGIKLLQGEKLICTHCLVDLPLTNDEDYKNNKTAKLFWGRVKIELAYSHFHYIKGSKYQNLIYQLKYQGKMHIGNELGQMIGSHINKTSFSEVNLILPVPLHYKKMKKRGFNQSYLIAQGIGEKLNIQAGDGYLERIFDTDTQTRKSTYDRWENVEGIFRVTHKKKLENKHILLVDDVITTGSTLESCASEILKIKGTKVSIITAAIAS